MFSFLINNLKLLELRLSGMIGNSRTFSFFKFSSYKNFSTTMNSNNFSVNDYKSSLSQEFGDVSGDLMRKDLVLSPSLMVLFPSQYAESSIQFRLFAISSYLVLFLTFIFIDFVILSNISISMIYSGIFILFLLLLFVVFYHISKGIYYILKKVILFLFNLVFNNFKSLIISFLEKFSFYPFLLNGKNFFIFFFEKLIIISIFSILLLFALKIGQFFLFYYQITTMMETVIAIVQKKSYLFYKEILYFGRWNTVRENPDVLVRFWKYCMRSVHYNSLLYNLQFFVEFLPTFIKYYENNTGLNYALFDNPFIIGKNVNYALVEAHKPFLNVYNMLVSDTLNLGLTKLIDKNLNNQLWDNFICRSTRNSRYCSDLRLIRKFLYVFNDLVNLKQNGLIKYYTRIQIIIPKSCIRDVKRFPQFDFTKYGLGTKLWTIPNEVNFKSIKRSLIFEWANKILNHENYFANINKYENKDSVGFFKNILNYIDVYFIKNQYFSGFLFYNNKYFFDLFAQLKILILELQQSKLYLQSVSCSSNTVERYHLLRYTPPPRHWPEYSIPRRWKYFRYGSYPQFLVQYNSKNVNPYKYSLFDSSPRDAGKRILKINRYHNLLKRKYYHKDFLLAIIEKINSKEYLKPKKPAMTFALKVKECRNSFMKQIVRINRIEQKN